MEQGKKWYSERRFSSVREIEDAYGIELLKLGSDELCYAASTSLQFYKYFDASSGAYLYGSWRAREDGVKIENDFFYYFGCPDISSRIVIGPYSEIFEYKIRSLGVTAQIISFRSGQIRNIKALFSYGGIDYVISAILDPYESAEANLGVNLDDITTGWLCEKLETLQKPSWVSETAGSSWETTSNVKVFFSTDNLGLYSFDAEEAGPSGVILTKWTINHDADDDDRDSDYDDWYPNVGVNLQVSWAPHDNLPTAEMEALLAQMNPYREVLAQFFDSVDEMEDAYGIKLPHLKAKNSIVDGRVYLESGIGGFNGYWHSTVKGISVKTWANYPFEANTDGKVRRFNIPLKSIDEEAEYKIRRLGVTARLVSVLTGTEEPRRCVMAFFSCDGVDYFIMALPTDGGKEPTINWLCRQLEKMHC